MLADMIPGDIDILNAVVLPALMPQISDPRIIIQSFNPPQDTVITPNLTPPGMKFNIRLPEIKHVDPSFVKNKLQLKGKWMLILAWEVFKTRSYREIRRRTEIIPQHSAIRLR